jgi:hypothetical protein
MINNKEMICKKILDLPSTFITLEEIKHFLRVDFDYDDGLINTILSCAVETCEKMTNLTLRPAKFNLIVNSFSSDRLAIPKFCIDTIDFVKINGQNITNYTFNQQTEILQFIQIQEGRVEIVFNTLLQISVPSDIKHAIMAHAFALYDNRDGSVDVPPVCRTVYAKYRNVKI